MNRILPPVSDTGGFPTVSKILNHAEPGVTATYDRHSYDKDKRQALEKWSRKLKQIVEGANEEKVVTLR